MSEKIEELEAKLAAQRDEQAQSTLNSGGKPEITRAYLESLVTIQ